jgi:hypothetical protein
MVDIYRKIAIRMFCVGEEGRNAQGVYTQTGKFGEVESFGPH